MKNYRTDEKQYAKGPTKGLCAQMFQVAVPSKGSSAIVSQTREKRWQEILDLLSENLLPAQFVYYQKDWLRRTPLMLAMGNYRAQKQRIVFEFPGFTPDGKQRMYTYNESRGERLTRFQTIAKLLQFESVKKTIRDEDFQKNTALRYAFNIVDFFHPDRQVREFYVRIMREIYTLSSQWHKDRGFIMSEMCQFCFSETPKFRCGACMLAKYCDKKCQKGFWTLFFDGQEKCCCRIYEKCRKI